VVLVVLVVVVWAAGVMKVMGEMRTQRVEALMHLGSVLDTVPDL
jgi:hypothetical protein